MIARLRLLEGTVAIFTHGHFGRVLGARWIGLSVAYARRLLLDTASISVLEYEYDLRGQPVMRDDTLDASFEPCVRKGDRVDGRSESARRLPGHRNAIHRR